MGRKGFSFVGGRRGDRGKVDHKLTSPSFFRWIVVACHLHLFIYNFIQGSSVWHLSDYLLNSVVGCRVLCQPSSEFPSDHGFCVKFNLVLILKLRSSGWLTGRGVLQESRMCECYGSSLVVVVEVVVISWFWVVHKD